MRKIAFSKRALSKAMLAQWMIVLHYEREDDAYQDARRWLIVRRVSPSGMSSGLWIAMCPIGTPIALLGYRIVLGYMIAAHPDLDRLLQMLWNDYKFIAAIVDSDGKVIRGPCLSHTKYQSLSHP